MSPWNCRRRRSLEVDVREAGRGSCGLKSYVSFLAETAGVDNGEGGEAEGRTSNITHLVVIEHCFSAFVARHIGRFLFLVVVPVSI